VAGPGGAKFVDDWVGHTTTGEYSTYDFVTTLTYFDPGTFMAMEIDSDWLVFTTD
jgi:hypothetical protein